MVRNMIFSGLAGMAIGYGAVWMQGSDEYAPPSQELDTHHHELERLRKEIAMAKLENDLLVRMVKAGLSGDIATHMNIYRQLPKPQQKQSATKENNLSRSGINQLITQEPAFEKINSDVFVSHIQKADIALQKQSIRENWADTKQLNQARRELWQEAKDQLTEQEYMAGLYRAGLPNMLYLDSVNTREVKTLGLKYGDVLIKVAGMRIYNRDDLHLQLEHLGQQSQVTLTFIRQGKLIEVMVTDVNRSLNLFADSIEPSKLNQKRS